MRTECKYESLNSNVRVRTVNICNSADADASLIWYIRYAYVRVLKVWHVWAQLYNSIFFTFTYLQNHKANVSSTLMLTSNHFGFTAVRVVVPGEGEFFYLMIEEFLRSTYTSTMQQNISINMGAPHMRSISTEYPTSNKFNQKSTSKREEIGILLPGRICPALQGIGTYTQDWTSYIYLCGK